MKYLFLFLFLSTFSFGQKIIKPIDIKTIDITNEQILNLESLITNGIKFIINFEEFSKNNIDNKISYFNLCQKIFPCPCENTNILNTNEKNCNTIQCSKITIDNVRCLRKTTNCSGRCWQHE